MAYDDELARQVRAALAEQTEFVERKMFGGLAFMVNTHMSCGIIGADLMVRVGKDNHEAALSRGAQELEFTGRPMRGMVVVAASAVADPQILNDWVQTAVEFARSEPPKKPKPTGRG